MHEYDFKEASIMINTTIRLGSAFGYQNEFARINAAAVDVPVTLTAGTNTFRSAEVEIGTLHAFQSRALLARVQFTYTYDEDAHVITVCGADFPSADAMTLVTFPAGTDELQFHRSPSEAGPGAVSVNPHWNLDTPLTPGLSDTLRRIVRGASLNLIVALQNVEGLTVHVRTAPPVVPETLYRELMTVRRAGLTLPYDPRETEEDDEVMTIESQWGGEVTFAQGENFANVIGSTGDPNIAGRSWLGLWQWYYNTTAQTCTSLNYGGFACGSTLVGGHVICGQRAARVPYGSNNVYIMPICHAHNNNDNVYMAALAYQKGIWLTNYHQ